MRNIEKDSALYRFLYGMPNDFDYVAQDFGVYIDLGPTTSEELLKASYSCICYDEITTIP